MGQCNSEKEHKNMVYVGVKLVLQCTGRDASKKLNVYGHKIAQSTSAMNVAELLKHVSKTVSNFHG